MIPLFIKAGSIIPIGPKVQCVTEKQWDNLIIRIYSGTNGEFMLYEDENDNYKKGVYSTIKFSWDDEKNILTNSNRDGNFPGMLEQRNFNIVKITSANEDSGIGEFTKKVNHKGKKVVIRF